MPGALDQELIGSVGRVTEQQTALAERQAQLTEKELESKVRRPADADAYAQRTVAAAAAEAINLRASALSDGNQALIAANKLIEVLPSLVEAAASGIAGSNLTVLNGTDGINEVVAGVVGQGLSIYDTLRRAVIAGNGSVAAANRAPANGVDAPVPEQLAASLLEEPRASRAPRG